MDDKERNKLKEIQNRANSREMNQLLDLLGRSSTEAGEISKDIDWLISTILKQDREIYELNYGIQILETSIQTEAIEEVSIVKRLRSELRFTRNQLSNYEDLKDNYGGLNYGGLEKREK